MKINYLKDIGMSVFEKEIKVELEVNEYVDKDGGRKFITCFPFCDTTDGNILSSVWGNSISMKESICDYIRQIKGKRLVFNAFTPQRREVFTPHGLYYDYLT